MRSHLEGRGVRFTRARRLVVRALLAAAGPQSAAELSDRLGGAVALSSLYRTLAVLEEAGVISPHLGLRGVTRYEPAEWIAGHHHHVVCHRCGAVEDFRLTSDQEAALAGLADEVASSVGFLPLGHSLEIDGECAACR